MNKGEISDVGKFSKFEGLVVQQTFDLQKLIVPSWNALKHTNRHAKAQWFAEGNWVHYGTLKKP